MLVSIYTDSDLIADISFRANTNVTKGDIFLDYAHGKCYDHVWVAALALNCSLNSLDALYGGRFSRHCKSIKSIYLKRVHTHSNLVILIILIQILLEIIFNWTHTMYGNILVGHKYNSWQMLYVTIYNSRTY